MVCQRCGTTSTDGNKFCPNCGAATGAGLDPVLLEEIEQKIKTALDARLTDQRIVEIDIQEKVVDRLKSLAKIVGIPLGLLLALLGPGESRACPTSTSRSPRKPTRQLPR